MRRAAVGLLTLLAVLAAGHQFTGTRRDDDVHVPGSAAAVLKQLPTGEPESKTGYTRADFGPAWSDDVDTITGRDGCDQRNNAMALRLQDVQIKAGTNGCVVLSGTLTQDPYTGATGLRYQRGQNPRLLSVDHVVPLGNAITCGARHLNAQQRQDLAGDPLNLLVVSATANSAKSDRDAANWLPIPASQCDYIARQIAVKARYRLWVSDDERAAMTRVLNTCPAQPLPTS